jgi:heme exporter protein A
VRGRRERSRELLSLLGLEPRADDRAGDLSRGLQQRLSVARALVHDPPLLFLDEPFTGLDPQAAERLRELLAGLRRRGRTLLLVTHDLRQGLELGDRWLLLAQGRIVGAGPTAGVDPQRFAADYVGRLAGAPAAGARA